MLILQVDLSQPSLDLSLSPQARPPPFSPAHTHNFSWIVILVDKGFFVGDCDPVTHSYLPVKDSTNVRARG